MKRLNKSLTFFLLLSLGLSIPSAVGSILKPLEEEIETIVKEAQPSLVSVYTKEGLGRDVGSGVIIRSEGYILTTGNVVGEGEWVEVALWSGERYRANLVGSDPESNIAVLKVEATDLKPAKIGDWREMKSGSWVIVLGNSFGLAPAVSFGLFSGKGSDDLFQLSALVSPGNSGGGVFNSDGELVGIVSGRASGPISRSFFRRTYPSDKEEKSIDILSSKFGLPYEGMALAIPISKANAVASQLIEEGKVERGWLGVIIQNLTPSLSDHFGVKEGVLVSDVVDESPAQGAGIKRGDVILKYGDKKVISSGQLRDLVTSTSPEEEVKLQIIRNGKEKQVKVRIGRRPEYSRIGREEIWKDFQLPDLEWFKEEFSAERIKEKLKDLEGELKKLRKRLEAD